MKRSSVIISPQKTTYQEIINILAEFKFIQNKTTDNLNHYSRRGEIIDLWTNQLKNPTRLLFDHELLTTIYTWDQTTKERLTTLQSLTIYAPEIKIKTSTQLNFNWINGLKIDDLVVHLDHGIAKFKGLTTQTQAEQTKNYLYLEFAKNDKLFLPVEKIDKLEKYTGGSSPKLNSLQGQAWKKLSKKTQADIAKYASELLNTQATRQVKKSTAYPPHDQEHLLEDTFPYQETRDQLKAIKGVLADLNKNQPLDSLICGDVGFGKTEVAIRASNRVVLHGDQVLVLCPTTILAKQHYQTWLDRFDNQKTTIKMLSRLVKVADQQQIISDFNQGKVKILIGTHRLLTAKLKPQKLGLLIIDEEQQFGVKDKEKLKKLHQTTHTLTLTATPIPRTLQLALNLWKNFYLIQSPPPGRKAIKTIISPYNDELVRQALTAELNRKGQSYYLYNKVASINIFQTQLQKLVPQAKIGIVHGQLKPDLIAQMINKFRQGEIDILLCSTIISHGLDLPQANTLIVHDATKFGLAQLYQIRGRIGRSSTQAQAYLLYQRLTNQEQQVLKPKEKKRLDILQEASNLGDGWQLALQDMELRGAGQILGKKQHGQAQGIGLNLYLQLLNTAIEEQRTGIKIRETRNIQIDIPISYEIPTQIIADSNQRLKLYQELSRYKQISKLETFRKTSKLKYKKHPQWPLFENLFIILKIKILAEQASISHLWFEKNIKQKEFLTLEFYPDYQTKNLLKILQFNPNWQIYDTKIKINKLDLRVEWIPELIETLQILNQT